MNGDEAQRVVQRTLRRDEEIGAIGRGSDVNRKGLRFPGHDPNVWLAVTQSRFVEVAEASGEVSSWLLPEIKEISVRKSLVGGARLHFNPSGTNPSIGLSIYRLDKGFASRLDNLLRGRAHAPSLPAEATSYERLASEVEGDLAAVTGPTSVEYRCHHCGGLCGLEVLGRREVFKRCKGCLRDIEDQVPRPVPDAVHPSPPAKFPDGSPFAGDQHMLALDSIIGQLELLADRGAAEGKPVDVDGMVTLMRHVKRMVSEPYGDVPADRLDEVRDAHSWLVSRGLERESAIFIKILMDLKIFWDSASGHIGRLEARRDQLRRDLGEA